MNQLPVARRFVERCESCVRKRAAGWALTESGNELWADLVRQFESQERELLNRGLVSKELLDAIQLLAFELIRPKPSQSNIGLLDIPQPEKMPDWDL